MFHRTKAGGIKPQGKNDAIAREKAQEQPKNSSLEQSAVQRYAKSQEEVPQQESTNANQNSTEPYAVKQHENKTLKKEANPMNNPDSQAKIQPQADNQQSQAAGAPAQGRVDIPGNNFQRPGAPAAAQASRPAYPGSYPGANSSSSSYQANDAAASGRQLIIGAGITMSGEIEACDHLVVEGTVEAALKGASMMDVAESGAFYGTVEIEEANIAGRFEGDITVKGRLTIESTGVVIGSISYKELAIEAGATLDGSVSPIGSQNAAQQQSGGKKSAPKARKVAQNNGAELPFSDKAVAAE